MRRLSIVSYIFTCHITFAEACSGSFRVVCHRSVPSSATQLVLPQPLHFTAKSSSMGLQVICRATQLLDQACTMSM